jgi:RNA-directed DNA polymerase
VVAPLEDRIVQRAILDVLQDADDLPSVRRVLSTPTSIGGIKGRGVEDAIRLFDEARRGGHLFVAGSDISSFFTKIKPSSVVEFLKHDIADTDFLSLVTRALSVELQNAERLPPDERKLFPTGDDGVAQGCPLSALAGNIVLETFDREMNDPKRGVICIRYIDDFIITGQNQRSVKKAMTSAAARLSDLGMSIYDPIAAPSKAFSGAIGDGQVFLGYELFPGLYPPSQVSRAKLVARIDETLKAGRTSVRKVLRGEQMSVFDRYYAQTLVEVDYIVRGWRGSYRASNCPLVFDALDREIEGRLDQFHGWFRSIVAGAAPNLRRRATGITLLGN